MSSIIFILSASIAVLLSATSACAQQDEIPDGLFSQRVEAHGIALYATDGVPLKKMEHARKILHALLLKDQSDGGAMITKIIERDAFMVLFRDFEERQTGFETLTGQAVHFEDYPQGAEEEGSLREVSSARRDQMPEFQVQDLEAHEIIVDYVRLGGPRNMRRDASIEEILHFIHAQGIEPVYPNLQKRLEWLTVDAIEKNLYNPHTDVPFRGAVYEYLALNVEIYYGIWQNHTTVGEPGARISGQGRKGNAAPELRFSVENDAPLTRKNLKKADPEIYSMIETLFPAPEELREAMGWE